MKKTSHVAAKFRIPHLVLIVGIIALVVFLGQLQPSAHSVEAKYFDTTSSGMHIVPASGASVSNCPTAAPLTPDGLGFILYPYTWGMIYNVASGIYVCAYNGGGSSIFVPNRTGTELQYFINAAPRLGVTITAV